MSDQTKLDRVSRSRAGRRALLLCLLGAMLSGTAARADDEKKRTVVGTSTALSALLHREGSEHSWRLIKPASPVYSEDMIVAVPAGGVDSKNRAVRLSLLSDLARLSPYPILESAVTLHDDSDLDMDLTLDRGRIDLTNRKREGAAHVRVRFRDQKWEITLNEPKARVALELYGRWPRGVPFTKTPKADDEPTIDVAFLVLQGDVDLKAGGHEFGMTAPPGPAYFHWDSAGGADQTSQRLEQLPGWAKPGLAIIPRVSDLTGALNVVRQRLTDRSSIEEALAESMDSPDENARKIAVYGLGALDAVSRLADALSDPKHEDVRDVAILALRHWIGRKAGQDMKLYEVLVKDKGLSQNQAEIVLQLLHSFGDRDLASPATYETLIEYLTHDKLAIRQLAKWHLARLAPAGKDITYDPIASPAERQRAYDEWKKLVPNGSLPPKPKSR